jgi:hypothetical protein
MAKSNSISSHVRTFTKTANGKVHNAAKPSDDFDIERPYITPEFACVVADEASQIVRDWLKDNAPSPIFDLFCAADALSVFVEQSHQANSTVISMGNSSVLECVATAIRAFGEVGASIMFEATLPRKVVKRAD